MLRCFCTAQYPIEAQLTCLTNADEALQARLLCMTNVATQSMLLDRCLKRDAHAHMGSVNSGEVQLPAQGRQLPGNPQVAKVMHAACMMAERTPQVTLYLQDYVVA